MTIISCAPTADYREEVPLLSYEVPPGVAITGTPSGGRPVSTLPPGRYVETQPPNKGYAWICDDTGRDWRCRVKDLIDHAVEPEAHAARINAWLQEHDEQDALQWLARLLAVAREVWDHIDALPWRDQRAVALARAVEQLIEIATQPERGAGA